MKTFILLSFSLFITTVAFGQYDQPSVGSGYINQTFYNIHSGNTIESPHASWDIAFSTAGDDAAIFVNEGRGSSMGAPLPGVEFFLSLSTDFSSVDTTDMISIGNNELSWSEGAFNLVNNPDDPFDFGWGSYNMADHSIVGNKVFIAKLRNDVYKKLEFQTLLAGTYTFRFADLDGANEKSFSISKADFASKTLVYFSIENEEVLDIEPAYWDLQFTRYLASISDGMGGLTNYSVTGVLSNKNVQIAQADQIDPYTVNYVEYENSFVDSIDAIGHDWKSFNLNQFVWETVEDRVYFVKTASDSLWKIHLIDFEGSFSGITTLEKTFETTITPITEMDQNFSYVALYPNPAKDQFKLAFELKEYQRTGNIQILDNQGKLILNQQINITQGLNVKTFNLDEAPGMYHVVIQTADGLPITKKVLIQ